MSLLSSKAESEVDALGVITISRGCFERCCSNSNSNKKTPTWGHSPVEKERQAGRVAEEGSLHGGSRVRVRQQRHRDVRHLTTHKRAEHRT